MIDKPRGVRLLVITKQGKTWYEVQVHKATRGWVTIHTKDDPTMAENWYRAECEKQMPEPPIVQKVLKEWSPETKQGEDDTNAEDDSNSNSVGCSRDS